MTRTLHPGAWWLWAIGLAAAASTTTNPLLLVLVLAVMVLVVVARRGDSPWSRAFHLYLWLGLAIIVIRVVLHVLVGYKYGETELLHLPEIPLPDWAAGITLLGPIRLASLLDAANQGLRLAVMVAAMGAANALANPKRLLKAVPGALGEVGTAVVVAVSVAPQLAESVQRVVRARRLRGDSDSRLRAFHRIVLPVLQDTLDRSIALASAMDGRGYGRRAAVPRWQRHATGWANLAGLLALTLGLYGLLDAQSPDWLGVPSLVLGLALGALGLWWGGRASLRTSYRPDPWRAAEWLTAACGLLVAAAFLTTLQRAPLPLGMTTEPLTAPGLPWLPLLGVLLAALPAFATPPPTIIRRRPPSRAREAVASPVDRVAAARSLR